MNRFQLITSPTCGPCHVFKAQLRAYELYDDVEHLDVSSPEAKEIITKLGLRMVPAYVMDGESVDQATFVKGLRAEAVPS